jgi:hypothetical protein
MGRDGKGGGRGGGGRGGGKGGGGRGGGKGGSEKMIDREIRELLEAIEVNLACSHRRRLMRTAAV